MDLVASHQPAIVIASSGMATGGRVLYHLAGRACPTRGTRSCSSDIQAAGTRGRARWSTARSSVRIKGRDVAGRRHDRAHRLDVGTRGRRRNPALAVELQAARR